VKPVGRPRRPWDRTPLEERDCFEILGPGLLSVVPGRRSDESGAGDWSPPTGGAWLHLDEEGFVRVFTGKVEVGQGTALALQRVVQRVLPTAPGRLEVIMGDTDLCPWDMGTFGSRSMPDAAPPVAGAAEGARKRLLDLAASLTNGSPADFELADGCVRDPASDRSQPYGKLVRGRRELVVAAIRPHWKPPPASDPVGPPDVGGLEIVTGRRAYGSDLHPEGLVHGAILHSPTYGDRAVEIDSSPLEGRPDVTVVRDTEFLGVVGPSPEEARSALAELVPRWASHPQPDERTIESHLRSHPQTGDSWDQESDETGDFEGALRDSAHRIVQTYRSAYIAHAPLETRCALAQWDRDRVTVWVGTQTPFRARDSIAKALGVSPDAVRVIVPPTGAGFGGKHGGDVGAAAARLARAVGRPVRIAYSREDEFRFAYFRPMSLVDVRVGADRDGQIRAWSFHNVNGGAAALRSPYRCPNQKVSNQLSDSPLPQGSYRALAATANNFARETAVDELARTMGVDPVDFRRTNLADPRLVEVLERTARRAGWKERSRAEGRGDGIAVGLEKSCRVGTAASVRVDANGKVRVERLVAVVDAGAVVHPHNLRSQVEGALVMGLGGALFEAMHFDRGAVKNPRFSDYRVPRFSDLPELDVELIDRPDIPPAGAGETPMIAVAPAIGNAIFDAAGVRLRALPLVPSGTVPIAGPARPGTPLPTNGTV
jgi:nicotinate dehydrogenase subunit B